MECKGCRWQSTGVDLAGNRVKYCIGSPEHDPKYGSEKVITKDRVISIEDGTLYRANDDDECHYWVSDRFEKAEGK